MNKRTTQLLTTFLIYAVVAFGQSDTTASVNLTVDDVVAMLEAHLPEQVVLLKIKTAGRPFTLSTEDLTRLNQAGASEKVMLLMMDPSAGDREPAAASSSSSPPAALPADSTGPFTEPGVFYRKDGQWMEMLPEIVNWKTGGVLKTIATAGVVKKDVNGHLPTPHSRNSVSSPLEFMIYMPEGVAITEYQLIRLRENPKKGYREFRTITGGVFNAQSGAMRDMVPFEGKKEDARLYSVVLPNNLGAGEYGFIYLGASGGAGGMTSLSMGKMYTFRLVE